MLVALIFCSAYFNPLSPHGERLPADVSGAVPSHFNPLSPHGERLTYCQPLFSIFFISIHSPRMGRDQKMLQFLHEKYISIHSPRMGRDAAHVSPSASPRHFNPLSPHGERRGRACGCVGGLDFNPLSPHGERLARNPMDGVEKPISIHSPRMGRDHPFHGCCIQYTNFNPLSPHGERQVSPVLFHALTRFQSTLPTWGETMLSTVSASVLRIFQSTLPTWGETF